MGNDQRPAEELSIEELEALLARKKVAARQERVQQFRRSGRALRLRPDPQAHMGLDDFRARPEEIDQPQATARPQQVQRRGFNRVLLLVEIAAVATLFFVLVSGLDVLRTLNREVAQVLGVPEPSPTPLITALVLPSGHTSPNSPGGARPNESEIPENLRPLVQSLPAPVIPTAGPGQAQSIFIPALWEAPAPVVQGDGWEQLKKGVGQHIGSTTPGQKGNMVLSAHNDIFGELFRDLDRLQPGDEVYISTAAQDYLYRITGIRIVEPTEVSVMAPTSKPTITLISCYPYLIDNQRIVVFGDLVEG